MEKVKLTEEAKVMLRLIFLGKMTEPVNEEQCCHLAILDEAGFIDSFTTKDDPFDYANLSITKKGKAYLALNPKLENPSIKDNTEFWGNLFVSVVSLFV